jgi:hypothetical protein
MADNILVAATMLLIFCMVVAVMFDPSSPKPVLAEELPTAPARVKLIGARVDLTSYHKLQLISIDDKQEALVLYGTWAEGGCAITLLGAK